MLKPPSPILHMQEKLNANGFQAFFVGGCVRDALRGLKPHDYDIATDALPEEIISLFGEEHCTFYGKAFGTVCVKLDGESAEITTFRTEADYQDSRHPGNVSFTKDALEDMSRRDFTCNAIGWSPQEGLFDPFGGADDLAAGVLRAVGDPAERFREDALRIMRGMRFYARFGLKPEENTSREMRNYSENLRLISVERVFSELCGMLTGEHITQALLDYPEILTPWIPEILACIDFEQHSRHHDFTVWEHVARSVGNVPPELTVRLTMLLHDIAKPECLTLDADGTGHFKYHAEQGAKMADEILKRLRADNQLRERVVLLINMHREIPSTMGRTRQILGEIGEEAYRQYLQVLKADCISKRSSEPEDLERSQKAEELFQQCLDAHLCCTLQELAVDGQDAVAAGLQGEEIGQALHAALTEVQFDRMPNDREKLLQFLGTYGKKNS